MNYPSINRPFNKQNSKITSHKGLGMALEKDINTTNKYYLNKDIAVIYKKPTPIQIVKVDYSKRSTTKIKEAYFKDPSTTDYNGIYKGKYIDFEAKECHNKTSFPINLIHKHQYIHLDKVEKHGAISFFIIKMAHYNETYLIKSKDFIKYISKEKRKSLPYAWIKENGYLIKGTYTNPCNYLEQVDIAFKKEI